MLGLWPCWHHSSQLLHGPRFCNHDVSLQQCMCIAHFSNAVTQKMVDCTRCRLMQIPKMIASTVVDLYTIVAALAMLASILCVAGYSNAGTLAMLALTLAAVAWPSLLSLPYLLLLGCLVMAWSASALIPAGSRSMRVVQVYTGTRTALSASALFFPIFVLLPHAFE